MSLVIVLAMIVVLAVVLRYKALSDFWWFSHRVGLYGVTLGAIGFALGFFGPMLLAPTSGNGPLLGIFITGPVGFLAGACWGIWKEWERRRA
ncbi:MAG TPA: hypothetical protein VHJ69_12710 [Gemmatimonadales bacterium]|jgi:hypothetical protein|nr:hypothetical protein [Gemmatimonadales bacterium]